MVKIEVSEASGIVLDWLVAMCEGFTHGHWQGPHDNYGPSVWIERIDALGNGPAGYFPDDRRFRFSTNWDAGGPILERERIHVTPFADDPGWFVDRASPFDYIEGPTLLIAAMRCYVAAKLGKRVEVPEELMPETK